TSVPAAYPPRPVLRVEDSPWRQRARDRACARGGADARAPATRISAAATDVRAAFTHVGTALTRVRVTPTPVSAAPTHVRATPTPVGAAPTHVRAARTPVGATPTDVRAARATVRVAVFISPRRGALRPAVLSEDACQWESRRARCVRG